MAELVDALVLGTSVQKTWGFESLHPHQESEEVIGLERCFKAHYEGHYNTEPELLNRHRQAVSSAEPSYSNYTVKTKRMKEVPVATK